MDREQFPLPNRKQTNNGDNYLSIEMEVLFVSYRPGDPYFNYRLTLNIHTRIHTQKTTTKTNKQTKRKQQIACLKVSGSI